MGLAEQYQDQAVEAEISGRIGAVLADQGKIEMGLEKVHHALELAHELEDDALIGEQQTMLAFLYQDLGNTEQAISYCKEALGTYQTLEDKEKSSMVAALLSELGG